MIKPTRLTPVVLCAFLVVACSKGRASSSGGEVVQADGELDRAIAGNAVLREAVKAIDAGHPWKATLTVAPIIAKNPRDRAAVLVAARAAAGWEGWTEVERLLAKQSWIDSAFDGEGRELLARAALAANSADSAIDDASLAVKLA